MAPNPENNPVGGGHPDRLRRRPPVSVARVASPDARRQVTFTQASMIETEIVRWLWGREAVGA